MAGNANLGAAKAAKNDEFYTQWNDIENEMQAYLEYDPDVFRGKTVLLPCDDPGASNFTKYFALNFEKFGLKKLISTSYAPASNPAVTEKGQMLLDFALDEDQDEKFNEDDTWYRGRIYVLEQGADLNDDGKLNKEDLKWDYLEGDGDFRSDEVTQLRDEADIVVTNPPFSLFREFLAWLIEGDVQFSIIGGKNSITYKEVFPMIRDNKLWLGNGFAKGNAYFRIPPELARDFAAGVYDEDTSTVHFRNIDWFTNIEHGRRHEPLLLMTMDDNLIYGSKRVRETAYPHYDNYDAIEVPETKGIPSDYPDVMGVPISFLDKHNPEQFEIMGMAKRGAGDPALKTRVYSAEDYPNYSDLNAGPVIIENGTPRNTYPRILIRHRQPETKES